MSSSIGMGDNLSYLTLAGLASLSFGAHLSRSSMTILLVYLVADDTLTPLGYSYLQGASSVPALFIPFISGMLINRFGHWTMTLSYLVMTCVGQFLFAVGVSSGMFWLMLTGQFVFGAGACCTVVAQRSLILISIKSDRSSSFATGTYVAMACFAKTVGKAGSAPMADALPSYMLLPYVSTLFCMASLMVGVIIWYADRDLVEDLDSDEERSLLSASASSSDFKSDESDMDIVTTKEKEGKSVSPVVGPMAAVGIRPRAQSLGTLYRMKRELVMKSRSAGHWKDLHLLPYEFWAITAAHSVYILVFHTLANFLPHYIVQKWGTTVMGAGFLASLSSIASIALAPLVGVVLDNYGRHIPVSLGAGVLASVAYAMLLYMPIFPVLPICLIAFAQAIIPTVLLSALPLFMPSRLFGLGFGVVEVADAIVNIIGNLGFGELYESTGGYDAGLACLFISSVGGVLLFALMIFLAYRWDRVDMFDETIAAYDSPVHVNPRFSHQRRGGSKETLGMSDSDSKKFGVVKRRIDQIGNKSNIRDGSMRRPAEEAYVGRYGSLNVSNESEV